MGRIHLVGVLRSPLEVLGRVGFDGASGFEGRCIDNEDGCVGMESFSFLFRDSGFAGFSFSAWASIILPLASDSVGHAGAFGAALEDLVMPEYRLVLGL